ncbi:tetratricopeptide repeat protein [Aromatoleum petrolei]|uniref:Tetratricopeptide repeat protein n=1 Tax=Aromatoleum petrolei TaxID=76116 RepID=A0ABX1MKH3_9RHOO|nr:tetratricopeptide repeat protein [Aromatoleum petrolei]NMF88463.1 tetratricopeptide repeat protein [Aromatoleum petrolei]QTQ36962.1 Tetratricopeptide repeat domain-containing [Aromatoleum petrolei]
MTLTTAQPDPRQNRFRLLQIGLIALPLLAIAIAYHAAPRNGFHLDDAVNIVQQGSMHVAELDAASLKRAAAEAHLPQRVLPNISLAIDWWRGNGSPAPFQLTNVLIHAATALAVLALLVTTLRRADMPGRRAWIAAATATMLWAVHPIQVQAVTYVVQRMTSMAALFMLVTLIAYVRARSAPRRWPWHGVAALSAIAACLSKETAYILPVLILLAEYTLCRKPGERIRSRVDLCILALPILATGYAVVDLTILHGPLAAYVMPGYASRDFTPTERLLTQPRVIFFHLGQMLLPLPERFSIEHAFPTSTSLWKPWTTALAIGGIAIWIAGGIWLSLRSRFPVAGFLVLWVPATLAIESSIVPLEMVFEHRMYLPSVGLAGLAALGLHRLADTRLRPAAITLAAVAILGFLASTLVRVPTWRTPVSLYEHAVRTAPDAPRAWTNLATAYEGQDRTTDAIAAYTKAVEIDPGRAIAYLNRGSSHRKRGDLAAAETDYQRFIRLEGSDYRGPLALGSLYSAAGRYDDAARWLERAAQLDQRSPLPPRELANAYFATGRPDATIQALELARVRDAAMADAAYFTLLGAAQGRLARYDEAIRAFDRALQLDPALSGARLNRGYAHLRSSKLQEALADFDAVIAGSPENAGAHYGRAEALAVLGHHREALDAAQRALTLNPSDDRAARLVSQIRATQP